MKVFYNSKIAKLFTFLPGFKTISLFGMVFTEKESLSERTICHETVHASQYSDLFVAGLMTAAFAYGIWLGLTEEHCLSMLWLLLIPVFLFYVWYLTECFVRLIINAGIETVVVRDDKDHYRIIPVSSWVEEDESLQGQLGY